MKISVILTMLLSLFLILQTAVADASSPVIDIYEKEQIAHLALDMLKGARAEARELSYELGKTQEGKIKINEAEGTDANDAVKKFIDSKPQEFIDAFKNSRINKQRIKIISKCWEDDYDLVIQFENCLEEKKLLIVD